MALLTTEQITNPGITPTYNTAAAGGDEFVPDGRTFIHVKNDSAAEMTVTVVTTSEKLGDLAVADRSLAIAAGAEAMLGPFGKEDFAAADGNADITYSDETSVTVGVFRL